MNKKLQKRKIKYIPMYAEGKITERECAELIGITPMSAWRIKERYLKKGLAAFINGNKGKVSPRKIPEELRKKIVEIYKNDFPDTHFLDFRDNLETFFNIKISYSAVRKILKEAGFKPPRTWSLKEKELHKPRPERESTGELVQMDASKHDWFMNGTYATLHGGIDDASHTVTGLYFCENECRLGYNEVLRQTWVNYGVPKEYYIDRHSSFVTSPRKQNRTLPERIELTKDESTHFNDLCNELSIRLILALSPQGKGRIERLWQTLQGKLPPIFRFLKIDTLEKANEFLTDWLKDFNAKYSRLVQKSVWKPLPPGFNLEYKLSIKFSCKTDYNGRFLFHGTEFYLQAPFKACKKFELCLSEQFGVKAFMNGKFYDVRLAEPYLQTEYGGAMPQVEQNLIARYLLVNMREFYA